MSMPTREEALDHFGVTFRHHGVKGQKWGVRKKSASRQEIRDATNRQAMRLQDFLDARRTATDKRATPTQRAKAQKDAKKFAKEFDTNEDRVTSNRLSRGQKVGLILLTGPIGAAVVVGNAIAVKQIAKSTDQARKEL